jgi:hypothetical protein
MKTLKLIILLCIIYISFVLGTLQIFALKLTNSVTWNIVLKALSISSLYVLALYIARILINKHN